MDSLTPQQIAEITRYLDATTPLPDKADLLFVFGSRQTTAAELAAALYRQQRAPYVVVTGGENRYTGHNEANLYCEILVSAGVPPEKIIVENRSKNTLENVTFALPLIEQHLALDSMRTVLAVCKWMHSRRALMTLKRHFPRGIRYYAHTYEPSGITRDNWHENPRAESGNVLKHWEHMPKYLEWGHIEEIVRDGDCYL
ncbi:MAG: YdcF family protein [Anaerolineae bacterium]